jgi:hypothetical protein
MLKRMSAIFIFIIVFISVILLSACSKNEPSVNPTITTLKDSTQPSISSSAEKYISQDVALDIAKKLDSKADLKWDANMIKDKQVEINNQKKTMTVWDVTAIYPAGNKMIVEIDAVTGKIISQADIEAKK